MASGQGQSQGDGKGKGKGTASQCLTFSGVETSEDEAYGVDQDYVIEENRVGLRAKARAAPSRSERRVVQQELMDHQREQRIALAEWQQLQSPAVQQELRDAWAELQRSQRRYAGALQNDRDLALGRLAQHQKLRELHAEMWQYMNSLRLCQVLRAHIRWQRSARHAPLQQLQDCRKMVEELRELRQSHLSRRSRSRDRSDRSRSRSPSSESYIF